MPNWCWNTLITSKKAAEKWLINKDGNVDFNILEPMPESLDVVAGSSNSTALMTYLTLPALDKGEKIKEGGVIDLILKLDSLVELKTLQAWIEESRYGNLEEAFKRDMDDINDIITKNKTKDLKEMYDEGKTLAQNYAAYGAINWYEWCNKFWGTKWNADDTVVKDLGKDVQIEFTTAWCPPEPILKKFAKKRILRWNIISMETVMGLISEKAANLPMITANIATKTRKRKTVAMEKMIPTIAAKRKKIKKYNNSFKYYFSYIGRDWSLLILFF